MSQRCKVECGILANILLAIFYSNCPYGFFDILDGVEGFPPNVVLDPHDFVFAGLIVGVPFAEVTEAA